MSYRKPNWNYWLNLAEVRLETAICLSMGYDPSILEEATERFVREDSAVALEAFKGEYAVRYRTAESHISAGTLYARRQDDHFGHQWMVDLPLFREWGESLRFPYSFPEEFPRLPPKTPSVELASASKVQEQASLNPKREKTLLRIIRALDALAELPERGAARQVEAKLEGLGFRSPTDDAIRDVLREARDLEPD